MVKVRRAAGAAVVWLSVIAGCSDALDQDTTAGQVVAVVAATSHDVTLVDVTRLETSGFDLAAGVPTSLDARGETLVVALGDSVQVATTTGAGPVVSLADGAAAAGVAIEDDSIAWAANSGLNSVTRINYRTRDTTTFVAGISPHVVVVTDEYRLVVNANVSGGQPLGLSSVRWMTRTSPLFAFGTFPLSCANARFATLGSDGFLYVVCAGTRGVADGKLAIVDPVDRQEVAILNGLGESPGPAAYHPSGRLLIASATEGILEVNTATRTLVRGQGEGIKPEGDGIHALVVDRRGHVYAVAQRGCTGPGAVHVLHAPPDYRVIETVPVGVCPVAAVLAGVPVLP